MRGAHAAAKVPARPVPDITRGGSKSSFWPVKSAEQSQSQRAELPDLVVVKLFFTRALGCLIQLPADLLFVQGFEDRLQHAGERVLPF